jgi:hypothetical protein
MATATSSETEEGRINEPDAVLTNGRFELPPSARGVLVLADPPEAGWRVRAVERGRSGRTGTARRPDHGPGCDRRPDGCASR